MTTYRIFLSYVNTDTAFVKQLMADLQTSGAEVVVDSSSIPDERYIPFLYQQLPQCQWLILIQTPEALQSLRVQATVSTALNLVAQQRMKGVLRIVTSSTDTSRQDELGSRTSSHEIMFDGDYPNLWNRISIEVGLISIQTASVISPDTTLPNAERKPSLTEKYSHPTPLPVNPAQRSEFPTRGVVTAHQPRRLWLVAFTMAILLFFTFVAFIINRDNISVKPITATATASTPTMTPQQIILSQATSGQPFINDPLQSQDDNKWSVDGDKIWSCAFAGGAYHAYTSSLSDQPSRPTCPEWAHSFNNVAYQVDMKLLQGDVGGVTFRAQARDAYYWFSLDADGCYELYLKSAKGTDPKDLLPNRTCQHFDMHATEQLTVVVLGSDIYLYVEGKYVGHVNDNTLSSGEVGVMCISRQHSTDVAFSSLKVWKLS